MSEKKGNIENKSVPKDEIDDFAQALLDKKTEMALLKDMPQTKQIQSETERKQAEQTLSSALDMLRQERGQLSIEEEEKRYNAQKNQEDAILEEEDFTTYSLGHEDLMNSSLKNVKKVLGEELPEDEVSPKKVTEAKEAKSSNGLKKVDPHRKQKIIALVACILIILGLMGAYAYKVYVYDPQNTITEEQQQAYDKLVAYADEWDMMSEAEKLEILDLKKDYDALSDKQKTEIKDYFKEQTGKTFNALYKEMLVLKEEQENEQNPDYQEIVAYLTNWSSKSDTEKMNILNLKSKYDALSTALQKKVDDLSREQCQKSFGALYTEYQEIQAKHNELLAKTDKTKEDKQQLEE